jgi:hypothetical protein
MVSQKTIFIIVGSLVAILVIGVMAYYLSRPKKDTGANMPSGVTKTPSKQVLMVSSKGQYFGKYFVLEDGKLLSFTTDPSAATEISVSSQTDNTVTPSIPVSAIMTKDKQYINVGAQGAQINAGISITVKYTNTFNTSTNPAPGAYASLYTDTDAYLGASWGGLNRYTAKINVNGVLFFWNQSWEAQDTPLTVSIVTVPI